MTVFTKEHRRWQRARPLGEEQQRFRDYLNSDPRLSGCSMKMFLEVAAYLEPIFVAADPTEPPWYESDLAITVLCEYFTSFSNRSTRAQRMSRLKAMVAWLVRRDVDGSLDLEGTLERARAARVVLDLAPDSLKGRDALNELRLSTG